MADLKKPDSSTGASQVNGNSTLRELAWINEFNEIISQSKPLNDTLQQIVDRIPLGMKYPDISSARIKYRDMVLESPGFRETPQSISKDFQTIDEHMGEVKVCFALKDEGEDLQVFLQEEQVFINNLCSLISGYINEHKAREVLKMSDRNTSYLDTAQQESQPDLSTEELLQRFLDRHNSERNLFHDLMPFKVKEILLIANLYDAYIIEGEGRFSDHILGEYHQMNLTSMPRVTGVSSGQEALKRLKVRHFDIIIIMVGVDKKKPLQIAESIKHNYPYIPTFLLLNNSSDLAPLKEEFKERPLPENVFIWNGDSKVFFAMVKLLEDMVNAGNDTMLGVSKIILLVEDSPDYYSKYLSILYSLVLDQTRHLIEDVGMDDLYKVLKMRARPKILLARSYEQSLEIIKEFGDNLFCLISDIRFPKNGVPSKTAGFELIEYVREHVGSLPIALQSSDPGNARQAEELNAYFINKNSETLVQDLKYFINYHIGFGHFVYRDNMGREIAVAKSMSEFESYLRTIPEDSLIYHAMKNHFSMWLMARGEVEVARYIYPLKITDFNNLNEMREFLINLISKKRQEKARGRIVQFNRSAILDEKNIVNMAAGSLGGKGRGLAFINTLIYNFNFSNLIPDINIQTPRTVIIGTDEFDQFLENNRLYDTIHQETDYEVIQKKFLEGTLSEKLLQMLREFLEVITCPIAIRSSSLLEDSINQPFSGVFSTFFLANNNELEFRLKQTSDAIKLVYASIYSDHARNYFAAINFKSEDEKMAIVIQEVVGEKHDTVFYPVISGTAQSFNYYPYAHMQPEEGFAVAALGLGNYVVSGERAFRFSPTYPELQNNTTKSLLKNSQVWFYAIDMSGKTQDLTKGDLAGLKKIEISEAERHGTLKHLASVYNKENDRLEPGLEKSGPRILNFPNILRFNYIPLAQTIKTVLDIMKEAFGTQVEIEYAVDLNLDESGKASFHLLQVKPLLGAETDFSIDMDTIEKDKILLFAQKSMGNGKITELADVVFIDPEQFDKSKTTIMAQEIERINKKMVRENRKYILIGPGRWGTRDRFIGIPVAWAHISNAKIIVEMSLKNFPLDASLGSHFFHNVTSMNVGYFSVNHTTPGDFISWDMLRKQTIVEETNYFKHVRFKKNLVIQMDGKKRIAVIFSDNQ